MDNPRAETVRRDLDALFHLGVVGGMSDGQLLERFMSRGQDGGQIAFEEVVRRHGSMVLGVCLRALGDSHAAEDAFQATFLVLALKARSVRKADSLGPWLHGVAARVARRALLLNRRRKETTLPAEDLAGTSFIDPELVELRAILDEELERLPEKYRRPLVLCYLEGQTQDQAARALGWTKGTVSGRLARAKELLRSRLTRRGLASSAAVLGAFLAPETASAAVPSSLLLPTVRAAMAASLAGMEAGLGVGSGQAAALARGILKTMYLGKIKAAVPLLLLTLGAAAVAAPRLWNSRSAGPLPARAAIPTGAAQPWLLPLCRRCRLHARRQDGHVRAKRWPRPPLGSRERPAGRHDQPGREHGGRRRKRGACLRPLSRRPSHGRCRARPRQLAAAYGPEDLDLEPGGGPAAAQDRRRDARAAKPGLLAGGGKCRHGR